MLDITTHSLGEDRLDHLASLVGAACSPCCEIVRRQVAQLFVSLRDVVLHNAQRTSHEPVRILDPCLSHQESVMQLPREFLSVEVEQLRNGFGVVGTGWEIGQFVEGLNEGHAKPVRYKQRAEVALVF